MMTKTSLSAATWASPKPHRVYSAPQSCPAEDPSPARDARRFQWHRHSCLCAVAKPMTQQLAGATLSLPSKFLIANPRLTSRVNPIRISKLKISNRKFSTISCPEARRVRLVPHFSCPKLLITRHLHALSRLCANEGSPATALLIETPRLKITISPILSSASNFLIETKCDVCIPDALAGAAFSVIPSPKTRIQCGARENPR